MHFLDLARDAKDALLVMDTSSWEQDPEQLDLLAPVQASITGSLDVPSRQGWVQIPAWGFQLPIAPHPCCGSHHANCGEIKSLRNVPWDCMLEQDVAPALACTQDYLSTPHAGLGLLRDLLADQPGSQQRLLELVRFLHAGLSQEPPKEMRGAAGGRSSSASAGSGSQRAGGSSSLAADGATHSVTRVALAVALYLYCHVDHVQHQDAWQRSGGSADAAAAAGYTSPTASQGMDATANAKLLRACVQLLAEQPIVAGPWGQPACALRLVYGCTQLSAYISDPALRVHEYFAGDPAALQALESGRCGR